jgi:hypothetical protein
MRYKSRGISLVQPWEKFTNFLIRLYSDCSLKYNRKPMLLRPLPDDEVTRLLQTGCLDMGRTRSFGSSLLKSSLM